MSEFVESRRCLTQGCGQSISRTFDSARMNDGAQFEHDTEPEFPHEPDEDVSTR